MLHNNKPPGSPDPYRPKPHRIVHASAVANRGSDICNLMLASLLPGWEKMLDDGNQRKNGSFPQTFSMGRSHFSPDLVEFLRAARKKYAVGYSKGGRMVLNREDLQKLADAVGLRPAEVLAGKAFLPKAVVGLRTKDKDAPSERKRWGKILPKKIKRKREEIEADEKHTGFVRVKLLKVQATKPLISGEPAQNPTPLDETCVKSDESKLSDRNVRIVSSDGTTIGVLYKQLLSAEAHEITQLCKHLLKNISLPSNTNGHTSTRFTPHLQPQNSKAVHMGINTAYTSEVSCFSIELESANRDLIASFRSQLTALLCKALEALKEDFPMLWIAQHAMVQSLEPDLQRYVVDTFTRITVQDMVADQMHTDLNNASAAFGVLVPFGGEATLKLGCEGGGLIRVVPGDVVALRDYVVPHCIGNAEKGRGCVVLYNYDAVFKRAANQERCAEEVKPFVEICRAYLKSQAGRANWW